MSFVAMIEVTNFNNYYRVSTNGFELCECCDGAYLMVKIFLLSIHTVQYRYSYSGWVF